MRERLESESQSASTSMASLVFSLLDEGLKTRRFPGVVYRPGPTGRRAALADGPDVWEVIRDLQHQPGQGDERIRGLADETGIPVRSVRLAADFYHAFAGEIDTRIEADERAAEQFRRPAEQSEAILSP